MYCMPTFVRHSYLRELSPSVIATTLQDPKVILRGRVWAESLPHLNIRDRTDSPTLKIIFKINKWTDLFPTVRHRNWIHKYLNIVSIHTAVHAIHSRPGISYSVVI